MSNTEETSHVFRPGPFHQRRAYWLDGAALHWRIGSDTGQVPLADIASMRLNLPAGLGTSARCVLVERGGKVHRLCDRYWPRWTKGERRYWGRLRLHADTFRALTFPLARQLQKANPEAVLLTGPGRGEWIATWLLAVLALAIVIGGAAMMIVSRRFAPAAAAFMALLVLYLPMLWPILRSGGPQPLDPRSLPDITPPHGPVDG